ncbi:MAG TPA: hypothetical protein VIY73_27800 [Polyangiaceae bacterium]
MKRHPAANPYAPPRHLAGAPFRAAAVVAPPTARVEGKLLVAENGSPLPAMCLKCGRHPTHWRAHTFRYTPPMAVFFLGWLGILIFRKRSTFRVPLCDAHLASWKKWNLCAGLSWLPGLLLVVLGAVVGGEARVALIVVGLYAITILLIAAFVVRARRIVTAQKIDDTNSWLAGVHPSVLAAVSSSDGVPYGG